MSENHDHDNLVRAVATWRALRVITREASGDLDLSRQTIWEARRDPDPDAWDAFMAALIDAGARFCQLAAEGHGVDPGGLHLAFVKDAHQGVIAAREAVGLDADLEGLLAAERGEDPEGRMAA